jgi:hypothetical protein
MFSFGIFQAASVEDKLFIVTAPSRIEPRILPWNLKNTFISCSTYGFIHVLIVDIPRYFPIIRPLPARYFRWKTTAQDIVVQPSTVRVWLEPEFPIEDLTQPVVLLQRLLTKSRAGIQPH